MQDIKIKYTTDVAGLQKAKELLSALTDEEKELVKQLAKVGDEAKKANDELEKGSSKAKSGISGIGSVASSVGGIIAGAFAVDKILDFGSKVLSVTSEFQKLQAVLNNALGSQSAGQLAFAKIQEFAAQTNFSVLEITDSFVKLANSGFQPTTEELRSLADLANSTGKSFDQLTEAIIDAQTGEFERLKEFGIKASVSGDQVKFTFKGVETQVGKSSAEIQKYILSLGELNGVQGATAAISETLSGRISNLGDATDNLLNTIGNKSTGAFNTFIGAATAAIQTIERLIAGEDELLNRETRRQQSDVLENAPKQIADLAKQYESLGDSADLAKAKAEQFFGDQAREDIFVSSIAINKLTKELDALIEEQGVAAASPLSLIFGDGGAEERINALNREILLQQQKQKVAETYLQVLNPTVEKEKEQVSVSKEQIKNLDQLKQRYASLIKDLDLKQLSAEADLAEALFGKNAVDALTKNAIVAREKVLREFSELRKDVKKNGQELVSAGILTKSDVDKQLDYLDKALKAKLAELNADTDNKIKLITPESVNTQQEAIKRIESTMDDVFAKNKEKADARDKEEREREQRKEDFRRELIQETFNIASDIGNTLFENQQIRIANELASIKDAEATKLAIVGDNEQAQRFIKEETNRKERELKIRQAKSDRNQSLFNIGISTAESVARTLARLGVPVGLPFAAIAAAIGAVQIGLVLSKPLPQFRKGVIKLQGEGSETSDSILARLSKNESVMTAQETKDFLPTLLAIRKGSVSPELLNNAALNRLPNGIAIRDSSSQLLASNLAEMTAQYKIVVSENIRMRQQLESMEIHSISLDKSGFNTYIQKGDYKKKVLNDQFR